MSKAAYSSDLIAHIAKLANISLSDDQLASLTTSMKPVMEHMNAIGGLDLSKVAATSRTNEEVNVWREDEVRPSISQADALKNAHKTHDGFIVIPSLFENRD